MSLIGLLVLLAIVGVLLPLVQMDAAIKRAIVAIIIIVAVVLVLRMVAIL